MSELKLFKTLDVKIKELNPLPYLENLKKKIENLDKSLEEAKK